ncbi:hypothetical protein AB4Z54_68720, partial [Streptomyces sp. MCAF7]
ALDGLTLAGPAARPLLVAWSRKSGRLRLWDIGRGVALNPMDSRGYEVTGVDSAFDGRGITLMIQGIAQNSVRCDQVFLPWRTDQPPFAPEAIGPRTKRP